MRTAVLDATTLETLVSAAVAAPSIHNTQPWRFRLDPGAPTLEIRAATRRGLRHIDPAGRALHLSVGHAVLNLRIAIELGREPVPRLLPRPDEPALPATVRLGGSARTSQPIPPLGAAVAHRCDQRTHRGGSRGRGPAAPPLTAPGKRHRPGHAIRGTTGSARAKLSNGFSSSPPRMASGRRSCRLTFSPRPQSGS
ncbi:hypothetical protein [Streptomyces canus]|uniref:hypothetical protein n=1 Tax=Streptomyces canus TaxID=58343 RepID=UPI003711564E